MMTLPLSGGLVMFGAFLAFLEDLAAYRKGEFHLKKPTEVAEAGGPEPLD